MFGKTLGPQFSWLEHAKLSHPISPSDSRETRFLNASVQSAARHADWCFRHDKSGCAGYSWLARFFERAGNQLMARFYHDIAGMRLRLTRNLSEINADDNPDNSTPEEIIAHAAAEWELVTLTDPETPTATSQHEPNQCNCSAESIARVGCTCHIDWDVLHDRCHAGR